MNVYVVGDSISLHYGPYLEKYLAGFAGYARKTGREKALDGLDLPRDANGGDSGAVLAFLRALAAQGRWPADLLLFNCGLHDIKTHPATGARQVPMGRYADHLAAILQTIENLGPRPIWIRSTPFDEENHNRKSVGFHRYVADLDAYNDTADRIMRAHGVDIIDLHGFTLRLGRPSELIVDHVHFREEVRALQGAFIAGWLHGFVGKSLRIGKA
jgi:hypothetical protein